MVFQVHFDISVCEIAYCSLFESRNKLKYFFCVPQYFSFRIFFWKKLTLVGSSISIIVCMWNCSIHKKQCLQNFLKITIFFFRNLGNLTLHSLIRQ